MPTEIWILESLPAGDTQTGTLLRDAILERAPDSKRTLSVHHRTAINTSELLATFDEITASVKEGNYPILHVEAHGNEKGLGLANGEIISWKDLSAPLIRLNELLRAQLIVTVAACSGGHMARTAAEADRAPFLALLGPSTEIWDNELYADYCQFYFEYDKTRSITKARWAMNAFKTATQDYYFSTAMNIFTQLAQYGNGQSESPEDRRKRMAEIAKRMAAKDPAIDVREMEALLIERYPDQRGVNLVLWNRFMFIDMYPENSQIFPFPT